MKTIRILAALVALTAFVPIAAGAQIMMWYTIKLKPRTAQVGDYENIHKVAVVSAIGDRLHIALHHAFLGSDNNDLNIADWQIDHRVKNDIQNLLASRFTFVDATYDSAAVAKVDSSSPDDLKRILQPRDDIDAYFVIRPYSPYDEVGMPGLSFQVLDTSEERINYIIDIIDAKTLAPIASSGSRVQPNAEGENHFAGRRASDIVIGENLAPTPQQIARLRGDFSFGVDLSVLETLRSLYIDNVDLPRIRERVLNPIMQSELLMPDYKSLAVISAVGDQVYMENFDALWFPGSNVVPTPEWNLDTEIETAMRASLAKRFRSRMCRSIAQRWPRTSSSPVTVAACKPSRDLRPRRTSMPIFC